MSTSNLDRYSKRLEDCFARVSKAQIETELRSDLSCYLCVLVSGYLENALFEIVVDYSNSKSAPQIARYIEKSLDRWTNPTCDKITSLFAMFKPEWKIVLESYLVDEMKDHINSLVGLRHAIAHGETASVTFSRIQAYYETVKKVVGKITSMVADT